MSVRNRSNYHYYNQNPQGGQPPLRMVPPMGGQPQQYQPQQPQQSQPQGAFGVPLNQILLMVFGVSLLLGLIAVFSNVARWMFIILVAGALATMWAKQSFVQRGRLFLSAVFGVLLTIALINAMAAMGAQEPPVSTYYTENGTNSFAVGASPTQDPFAVGAYTGALDASGLPVNASAGDSPVATAGSGASGEIDPMTGGLMMGGSQSGDPAPMTEAEKSLEAFMEAWKSGIADNMVPLTSPAWRSKMGTTKNGPSQNLYWKFSPKKLENWYFDGKPTGTDQDESRTITVYANVEAQGSTRTYRYDALVIQSDKQWYVDPDSLAGGTRVDEATLPPDSQGAGEVLTITPTPAPPPTEVPGKNTTLYYNSKGGKYYHIQAECPSVDKSYLPLSSFSYADLDKSSYSKLSPCVRCNAPGRQ